MDKNTQLRKCAENGILNATKVLLAKHTFRGEILYESFQLAFNNGHTDVALALGEICDWKKYSINYLQAYENGHFETIDQIIKMWYNKTADWSKVLEILVQFGSLALFKEYYDYDFYIGNLEKLFSFACKRGKLGFVKFLLKMYEKDFKHKYGNCLFESKHDTNRIFWWVHEEQLFFPRNAAVCKFILRNCKIHIRHIITGFRYALDEKNYHMAKLFLDNGAKYDTLLAGEINIFGYSPEFNVNLCTCVLRLGKLEFHLLKLFNELRKFTGNQINMSQRDFEKHLFVPYKEEKKLLRRKIMVVKRKYAWENI